MEDRDNLDYIEANGPFLGNLRDRWLGPGFYYWDTFINSAHFWGWVSYKKFRKDYVIAKSEISLPPAQTLNLLEPTDLLKFKTWVSEFENTFPQTNATIEKVIVHIQHIMGDSFPYIAIRALFNDCINKEEFQDRISPNGKAYIDLQPPIQVCIKDKSVVGENNFKVIYPTNYTDNEAYVFN